MASRLTSLSVAALWLAVAPAPALASDWELELTPYVWAIGAKGNVGIGPISSDVDVGFRDLLERLNLALMLQAEARWGRWLLLLDGRYTSLADRSSGTSSQWDLDQAIVELGLGYRVLEDLRGLPLHVDAWAGTRIWYNDLKVIQQIPILPDLRLDVAESFAEPLLGVRVGAAVAPRLGLELGGDVGGFGLGSDLAWNLYAQAEWRLSRRWNLGLGYRLLGSDFEETNSLGGTRLGLRYFGPYVGVSYAFGPGVPEL